MANVDEWVIIGRFGRAHGIKGFITINSFTDPRDNILRYTDWHGFINQQWRPLPLSQLEMNNKFILAKVEGYNEREELASLTNIDIAIRRSQLPELKPDEYYWHQLIGMQVINTGDVNLGKVVEIMPTGSNDVLVVEGEQRHLIPYLPDIVIKQIDGKQKLILIDWDEDF